jgi:hypothetical protein
VSAVFTVDIEWFATTAFTVLAIMLGALVITTVGVYYRQLRSPFWQAFCVVGWLFALANFMEELIMRGSFPLPLSFDQAVQSHYGRNILQSILTLVCASCAGVIASYCVRRSSQQKEQAP